MSNGSDGFPRRLHAEIGQWQADGIITAEQAAAIRQRYAPAEAGSAIGNRTVSVIAIMGVALIGAGIIAFIAANWPRIDTMARLALLIGGAPAIYVAGWALAYRGGYVRTGTAVILLGAIAFGAAIHLIAQIYHVPVNHPNLVPLWFLGVAPLAYITRSRAILAFSIALLLAAAGFRAQQWLPDTGDALMLLLPLFLLLGAALFAAGRLHARFAFTRPFARIFDLAGLLVASAAVYLLSYHILWQGIAAERGGIIAANFLAAEYWAVAGAAAALSGVAVGVAAWRLPARRRPLARWEIAAVAAMVAVAAGTYPGLWYGGAWLWWVFNLVILAAVLGMIAAGCRWNRAYLINLAVIIFAITLFTRYFEFGFSLLEQSLAFIVAGAILLAGGFGLEFLRRRLLKRIPGAETRSTEPLPTETPPTEPPPMETPQ